jgi:hypothetical protein
VLLGGWAWPEWRTQDWRLFERKQEYNALRSIGAMSVVPTTIRTMRACFVLALSLILPGPSAAVAQADAPPDQVPAEQVIPPSPGSRDSICLMIESAARENGRPIDYFARVIWQESRFQPDAIGSRTDSAMLGVVRL